MKRIDEPEELVVGKEYVVDGDRRMTCVKVCLTPDRHALFKNDEAVVEIEHSATGWIAHDPEIGEMVGVSVTEV